MSNDARINKLMNYTKQDMIDYEYHTRKRTKDYSNEEMYNEIIDWFYQKII